MSIAGSLLVPAIRLPRDYGRLAEFERMAVDLEVAGFIVFGGDRDLTPPFLARLKAAAGRPLLVMADYERGAGGMVPGYLELPPAMALGATRSPEAAYMAGKITALSARDIGVNVVLAPVLDVLSRPDNPILGTRAFSDDPDLVTQLGLAFIEGVQEEGVLACAKHFPGHGDTALDSHTELPTVDASPEILFTRELPPFRRAVRAGVGMVMTAHVVYAGLDPANPATFSSAIVKDLLFDDWGYRGLVITDALVMAGARASGGRPEFRALAAGVDLLLYPEDPWGAAAQIEAALDLGELSAEDLVLRRGRIALAAGDLQAEAPTLKDMDADHGYRVMEMARRSISVMEVLWTGRKPTLRYPGELVVQRPQTALGLIVDDDGVPRRARAFDLREDDFDHGVVHVTAKGAGRVGDLAGRLRETDLVIAGLFGDVSAGKGRVGLGSVLQGFVTEVLKEHAAKTWVVTFGAPELARGLPARHLVFAWSEAEAFRRAALDLLFDGGVVPARPPLRIEPGGPGGW